MRTALLAVALLAPLVAAAQGADPRADFTVAVQTPDGQPVPGATVLVGTDRGAAADADGQAVFEDVAPGRYAVRVSFVGRPTREVAAVLRPPGPWGLIVELADDANLLYDVVVEARSLEGTRLERDGFFDRLALGGGAVLTAEEISRRNPLDLADVLRGGVLGTRVQRGSTGAGRRLDAGGRRVPDGRVPRRGLLAPPHRRPRRPPPPRASSRSRCTGGPPGSRSSTASSAGRGAPAAPSSCGPR